MPRMQEALKAPSNIVAFHQNVQLDTSDPNSDEPCLILARRAFNKGCSFVIPLSAAWKYTDDQYLMQQAMLCAEVLLMQPIIKSEVIGIADTIMNGIDGLVKLEPRSFEEARRRAPQTEGTVTINGKPIDLVM